MQSAFLVPFAPPRPAALIPSVSPRRRGSSHGAVNTKSIWVERSATVIIEATPEETYDSYIDLEAMPSWSPWLRSVVVDDNDPDVSRWTLAARGFEFSWKARNTNVKRGEVIAWTSESGLRNRGRVVFKDKSGNEGTPKSSITLAIEFDVPGPVASIIDNNFIGSFVESTLLADLQRFRKIALAKRRRARSKGLTASSEREG